MAMDLISDFGGYFILILIAAGSFFYFSWSSKQTLYQVDDKTDIDFNSLKDKKKKSKKNKKSEKSKAAKAEKSIVVEEESVSDEEQAPVPKKLTKKEEKALKAKKAAEQQAKESANKQKKAAKQDKSEDESKKMSKKEKKLNKQANQKIENDDEWTAVTDKNSPAPVAAPKVQPTVEASKPAPKNNNKKDKKNNAEAQSSAPVAVVAPAAAQENVSKGKLDDYLKNLPEEIQLLLQKQNGSGATTQSSSPPKSASANASSAKKVAPVDEWTSVKDPNAGKERAPKKVVKEEVESVAVAEAPVQLKPVEIPKNYVDSNIWQDNDKSTYNAAIQLAGILDSSW